MTQSDSFLWLSNIPLYIYIYIYIYHIFFIHSSVDGPLGCFHGLAFVNSACLLLNRSETSLLTQHRNFSTDSAQTYLASHRNKLKGNRGHPFQNIGLPLCYKTVKFGSFLICTHYTCYWVKACERWSIEARQRTLFGNPADRKDYRLVPQNNHLIGVWMPGSFIDQRERSNEKQIKRQNREGDAVGK